MKPLYTIIGLFLFFSSFGQNEASLKNAFAKKTALDNLLETRREWKHYKGHLELKKDTILDSGQIMVGEILLDSLNAKTTVKKVSYLFINCNLVLYTITYFDGGKPSNEELIKLYGIPNRIGNSLYWDSDNQEVSVQTLDGSNELIIAFGK